MVLFHYAGNHFAVGDIAFLCRAGFEQLTLGFRAFDISSHNMFVAVTASQLFCQFRTNLSGRTDYQNILHNICFCQLIRVFNFLTQSNTFFR